MTNVIVRNCPSTLTAIDHDGHFLCTHSSTATDGDRARGNAGRAVGGCDDNVRRDEGAATEVRAVLQTDDERELPCTGFNAADDKWLVLRCRGRHSEADRGCERELGEHCEVELEIT